MVSELLATLALKGCIVTIDAMGTQPNIAQPFRDWRADYVLAIKDNQPKLARSSPSLFDQRDCLYAPDRCEAGSRLQ